MRRLRRSVVMAALVMAVSLAGCGISTTGGPRAIAKDQVPTPGAVPTTSPNASCSIPVTLVFLNIANQPTPGYGRCVSPQDDQLGAVVRLLLAGPVAQDLQLGLFSQIPTTTRLLQPPVVKGSSVTLNFSADFLSGNALTQEQEATQVVFTVACWSRNGNVPVNFEVEGNPQSVPIANGTTVDGPVSATADYNFGTFNAFGAFNCTPNPA